LFGALSCDQRLSVRIEAEPRAGDLLAWLATMPMRSLDFWAERKSLLRDVGQVVRSGSDHVDDVAIPELLGKQEILDMGEHVSVENAIAFFFVSCDCDKMDLARRSTPAFYGLPKVRDFSRNVSLPISVRRAAPVSLDREEGIQGEPSLPCHFGELVHLLHLSPG
jgi:hypothetical protein